MAKTATRKKISTGFLRDGFEPYDERLLLPKKVLAHAFGVHVDALGKWGLKPVKKIGVEVFYYLPEAINMRQGGDGNKLDPGQEKAKLDAIRREGAELELSKKKGELVSIDEVCKTIEKECVAVRQKLLALPNKLAGRIAEVETPKEAQEMIWNAVWDALKDLNYGGKLKFKDGDGEKGDDIKG